MHTSSRPSSSITEAQAVRLTVVKIREVIKLGPEKAKASSTELIMAAFATCDRQRWLPKLNDSSAELWSRLDQRQRDAVVLYLGSVPEETTKWP